MQRLNSARTRSNVGTASQASGSSRPSRVGLKSAIGPRPKNPYLDNKKKALEAKNTVIVNYSDLERMRDLCADPNSMFPEKTYMSNRTATSKNLHVVSRTKVQAWPNTLVADREKRERDRIAKLEKEEMARRAVDAKEEALRVADRQSQLDRANKMFHDNQDAVKALHSKMLLCDVNTEQAIQIQTKKQKAQLMTHIDKQWEELEKQKMEEYDKRVLEKAQREADKKKKNSEQIANQLEEYRISYIKKMKEEQAEGLLIKKQVEENMERENMKELEKKKKVAKTRQEFKDANDQLIKLQQQVALKEQEEEKKITEYQKKRLALEHLKKTKVQERFAKKQAGQQKLVDKQIAELMKVRDQEEEILNKQVAEAENKALILQQKKEQRRLQMQREIDVSRKNQINRKAYGGQQKKLDDIAFDEFWKMRNEELQIAESQEKEEQKMRSKEISNYRLMQIDNKNKQKVDDFVSEQHSSLKEQALVDQQQKNFCTYAEKCISEWTSQGKNVKPLIMELKNYKRKAN